MTKPELNDFAETLRDSIHNLDLSISDNQEIFFDSLRSFIRLPEGERLEAYDDKTPRLDSEGGGGKPVRQILASSKKVRGNVTIGVGFNMDAGKKKGGREEWDDAFGGAVDFDEVYEGKLRLTQEQADQLFNHNLNVRLDKVKNIYEESWDKLRANERIAIVSAYFNGRKLVGSSTNFYAHITAYVKTGDRKHLSNAVEEMKSRSNPDKNSGVQNRRDYDSTMLNSIKAKFYSPPNSPLIPNTEMKIIVGQTIVPIGMNRFFLQYANAKYFIWRTRLDDKVRADHFKKEGKVFRRKDYYDNSGNFIGEGYNCRCKAEDPTINLIVQEDDHSQKSVGQFLRFGGGGSIMIFN